MLHRSKATLMSFASGRRWLGGAACRCGIARAAAAQAPQRRTKTGTQSFASDTRLVVLHATVVDKSGHLVTNLPKTAFQVYENDVQQHDQGLQARGCAGLHGPDRRQQRQHARQAREGERGRAGPGEGSNPQDEVFVVNFNDEAFLDTKDFTSDIKDMEEALSKIDSRGGTAMRDAIRMSIDEPRKRASATRRCWWWSPTATTTAA